MAIGDVKASGGLQAQLVSDRSSEITAQAIGGLGDAVNRLASSGFSYLNSKTDIEKIYDQRAMKSESLELDTRFLKYQQDRANEFTQFARDRSSNPLGMTRDYDAMVGEREKEFLATVPPRHREEMATRLAQDRVQRVGSAFSNELSLMDTADTNTLNTSLNQLGSGLKGKQINLEDAQAEWEDLVYRSGLPDETKQEFVEKGKATLQGLEFGTLVEEGAAGYGAVRDGKDGSDVVAAGLMPQERAVLNAIAKNEAKAYNLWNGGTPFEGYEDHPAETGKAPGESTAAGRYQFIIGTWRLAKASYERTWGVKVPNFSPEWQDRVALHWAEVQFNKHYKGSTFKEILASGDPARLLIIRDVLGKPRSSNPNDLEWKGLGQMKDAEFLEMITGLTGIAGGGTGPATMPDIWTDPRFSNLGLEQKLSFANSAKSAADQFKTSEANRLRLERDSFLDSAYEAGYRNEPGVLEALKQSQYWGAEAQAKYNSGQEVFRKSENDVAKVGAQLADGTPLSADSLKAFGKWFGEDRFTGIMQGDKDAYAVLGWAVDKARIFPDGSVDAFRSALGNPATKQTALEFLAAAHLGDSSILRRSGFSQADIADIQLFANIAKRSADGDKAFEDYSLATDASVRTGKSETVLANEGSKLFQQKYPTADKLVDHFDGWFSFRPDSKLNPRTEDQLLFDAASAFQDGYKIKGTEEGATAYMEAALEAMWGVSATKSMRASRGPGDFGGETFNNVLMKFPPEKYYPAHDNDYNFLYRAVSEFALAGGASANNAVLVADAQTEQEVKEGKPPTYKVIGQGEFGEALFIEGRFGGQELMDEQVRLIEEDFDRVNAVSAVGAATRQILDVEAELGQAAAMGAPQEEIDAINQRLLSAKRQKETAEIAAQELGYLGPTLSSNVDEAFINNSVQLLATAITSDPAMEQRVAMLQRKYQGKPGEARTLALIEVVQKEMRVTEDVAILVVKKFLESAE